MSKLSALTSTLVALVLATQVSPALSKAPKHGWTVVEGASTKSTNLTDFCKQNEEVKIWVEGASTAHMSGVICKTITVHVEGASTLCLTGTGSEYLKGVVEGASTLLIGAGIARKDDIDTKGASTYKRNTAHSFVCGAIGHITQ